MATIKILTNQGLLVYEANTVIFNLDTHGGVKDFEDRLYNVVRQAEMIEESSDDQEEGQ